MASSSPQDVVNNPESTEAQPVDISASDKTLPAPHGTNAIASSSHAASNSTEPFQPAADDGSSFERSTESSSIPYQEDITTLQHNAQNGNSLNETQIGDDISKPEVNPASTEPPDNDNFEAASVRSAGFEGSLGSDTDTNKMEANGVGKDAVPRYSVKKPVGFKPVSVTKSFLAKAGTTVLPIKTVGDKGTS